MSIEIFPKKVEIIRPNTIYAEITPKILIWARETRGWDLEKAAKKTKISPNTLKLAESGEKKITLNQLINLAKAYKRPIPIFYSDEIPEEKILPDLRQKGRPREIDGNLYVKIREILGHREFALELNENPKYDFSFIGKFSFTSLNSEIIQWIQDKIKLSWRDFGKKKDNYVLEQWINKIESLGIFVFQFPDIDVEDTRGFSISEIPFPIIGLNRKDSYYARVFSLIHELVHLLISEIGICTSNNTVNQEGIEKKCDSIAAAIIIPPQDLLKEIQSFQKLDRITLYDNLPKLSDKFKVSYSAILISLYTLQVLNTSDFRSLMASLPKPIKTKQEGGPHPAILWKSRTSNLYLNMVFNAIENRQISRSDAILNLNISTKIFSVLENLMEGRNFS